MKKAFYISLVLILELYDLPASQPDSLKRIYYSEAGEVKKAMAAGKIINYFTNNYDSALYYSQQFIDNSRKAGHRFEEAYIYHMIGSVGVENSKYDEAKDNLKEAIHRYSELKNDSMIARAYIRIAFVYYTQADYETAIKIYLDAINHAQKANKLNTEAWALNLLGLVFYEKPNPDYKTALSYYLKSLAIYKKRNLESAAGMVLMRIGSTYTKLKDYKSAARYLQRASQLGDSMNDPVVIKWTLNALSQFYRAQNEYVKSNEIEKRSKALSLEYQEYPGIVIAYRNIAENQFMLKNHNAALENADSSIFYSVKHNIFQTLPEIYELKSSILDGMGRPHEALAFYKKGVHLKDSLFSVQNSNNINELQTKFGTREKEKEIQLLNVEKENDRKMKNVLIAAFMMALVSIAFIVFVLLKINSARKKMKQQKLEIERQKNIVDEKQKEILDSISYAQRIQKAQMPSEKYIEKNLERFRKKEKG